MYPSDSFLSSHDSRTFYTPLKITASFANLVINIDKKKLRTSPSNILKSLLFMAKTGNEDRGSIKNK